MRSHSSAGFAGFAGFAGMLVLAAGCATGSKPGHVAPTLGRGQPITEQELVAWNIDVRTPDGVGLPPGSGTVAAGKLVFDAQCAS